jgi:hypothetical protein
MHRRIEQPHTPALLIESARTGSLLFVAEMTHHPAPATPAYYHFDCAIGASRGGGQHKEGMLNAAAAILAERPLSKVSGPLAKELAELMKPEPSGEGLTECQNCCEIRPESELDEIDNLLARLAPGDIVPVGQCPDCGALCQPVRKTN